MLNTNTLCVGHNHNQAPCHNNLPADHNSHNRTLQAFYHPPSSETWGDDHRNRRDEEVSRDLERLRRNGARSSLLML
jgi:hypothetical protein